MTLMCECYLGLCAGLWLSRELDFCGFEDGVFLKNILLRLVVTKRLGKKERRITIIQCLPCVSMNADFRDERMGNTLIGLWQHTMV